MTVADDELLGERGPVWELLTLFTRLEGEADAEAEGWEK